MLRMLVLVLLLANGVYFAWAHGHLATWAQAVGLSQQDSAAQANEGKSVEHAPLHPEAIVFEAAAQPASANPPAAPREAAAVPPPELVVAQASPPSAPPTVAEPAVPTPEALPEPLGSTPPDAAELLAQTPPVVEEPPAVEPPPVVSPPPVVAAPKQCMAVGPFSAEQMEPIRSALQGIARNQWRIEDGALSGRWMVFWGGATDELVLSARRGELQSKNVSFERLRTSPVGIGYSLGRFSTEAAAQQHKRDVERKGIRGTSIEVERAPGTVYTVEFPDYASIKDVVRRDVSRYFGTRSLQAC